MEKIIIFIGILIVLVLLMLWYCLVVGNRADSYKKKLKELQRRFELQTREYNTLTLKCRAYEMALNTEDIKSKH